MKRKISSPLSQAQIKKYKKLQVKAEENTQNTGYFIDEFDYYYGNLAEDLISVGDKEWAREIYKIVEDNIGVQIDGGSYLSFAGAVAIDLGDKEWAKKIYKDAEESGMVDKDELADEIISNLDDEKWAKKIRNEKR